jgi:hypothetical protein
MRPAAPTLLSPLNGRLIDALSRTGTCANQIDLSAAAIPEFLRSHRFPVSRWPIFISRNAIDAYFGPFVRALPRIAYKALRTTFGTRGEAFARYFEWPRIVYDILQHITVHPDEIIIRYDLTLSEGGDVKLLEINCGSSLGGWPLDWLQTSIRSALAQLPETAAWNTQYREVYSHIVTVLLQSIRRRQPRATRANILFHSFAEQLHAQAELRECLSAVYVRCRPPEFSSGRIFLFSDFASIQFSADGAVMFEGETMDAVVVSFLPEGGIPDATMHGLCTAYLKNHIVFPDSPFHAILGDKRMFSLLHECSKNSRLTPEENALVERYVPWTTVLRDEDIEWRGKSSPLRSILTQHKDSFVVKKADSFGGKYVAVGKHVEQAQWEAGNAERVRAGDWIAQEFHAPGQMLAMDATSQVSAHELIWGVFAIGQTYGGAFIRACRPNECKGIINAANGATEFLVLEDSGTHEVGAQ